jgi:prepilin-type N-terminal cleavage/methylation domain-containing protein
MNGRLLHSASRHTAHRDLARAFTLAEVLATMLLVGIVLPVVMRGVSVSLLAAQHARNTALAASLAEAKLTELVTTATWSTSSSSGDFTSEWPEFRWKSETYGRSFSSYELVLTVIWTERDIEQSFSCATIVYASGTTSETQE